MASYSPPSSTNIPFNFSTGGYTAPGARSATFDFGASLPSTADLRSAIQVMQAQPDPEEQTWQTETYSYLKYCDKIIIGYSTAGVQILQRCFYGGIRDLGAYISVQIYKDLPAFINVFYSDQRDLPASILGLPSEVETDLPAIIGGHLPGNLAAQIRGFAYRGLPALITSIYEKNLPAYLTAVPPQDLPAYLKIWPQRDLPATLHSWQDIDLPAVMNIIYSRGLPAIISGHKTVDLTGVIKGWVREAYRDLSATIMAWAIGDLPTFIRGSEMLQLPAYVIPVPPRDLGGTIHAWHKLDLPTIILGDEWPYDLKASIIGTGLYRNLPAYVNIMTAVQVQRNLAAYILGTAGVEDLPAFIKTTYLANLGAFIDTGLGVTNLGASIYPKMIRLTAVLPVITMEHTDLAAVINISCFGTGSTDLNAYLRTVYKLDLQAVIRGVDPNQEYLNLGALWGYTPYTVYQDKLPVNINITPKGYRTEDKFRIRIRIFRQIYNLGAYVYGDYLNTNLAASILAVPITPIDMGVTKSKEYVYELIKGQVVDYQKVYIEFEDMVREYLYNPISEIATKSEKYHHWRTKVSSMYSPKLAARLDRRIHKTKILYDLNQFESIDEAVRYAINYVTTDFYSDIKSYIYGSGAFTNLGAKVTPLYIRSVADNLGAVIVPQGLQSGKVYFSVSEAAASEDELIESAYYGGDNRKHQVTASSYYYKYPPEEAFDGVEGKLNNQWGSDNNGANPDGSCWLQWDFEHDKYITKLRMQRRFDAAGGFPRNMEIYVSYTGDFTGEEIHIGSVTNLDIAPATWSAWHEISNPTEARYLRIEIHTAWQLSGSEVQIAEVQFLEAEKPDSTQKISGGIGYLEY